MQRIAHETVSTDDPAIRLQPAALHGRPDAPEVAAPVGGAALPGAEEVQAAQLEAVAGFPDAGEHRPMALVALGVGVIVAEVWLNGERKPARDR